MKMTVLYKNAIISVICLAVVAVGLVGCKKSNDISILFMDANHKETINNVTVGIREVLYRPKYESAQPLGPAYAPGTERGQDRVVVLGYICNYRPEPINVYNIQRFNAFSWGDQESQKATNLTILNSDYETDEAGNYFVIPPNSERPLVLSGDHIRLSARDSNATLELGKIGSSSTENIWSIRFDVLLEKHQTEVMPYYEVYDKYPALAAPSSYNPEPKCSF